MDDFTFAPPKTVEIPSLVSILIDLVLKHKLVDDTKLLEATSQSNGGKNLITFVSTTYSELPMDIQHRVMERCVELSLLDDFWVGYFIPGINELAALNARGSKITDAGVELVVGGCPSLLSLDLSFCTHITDNGFSRLVDLTELENLSIEGTKITSQGLLALCRLNSLLNVNIKGCMLVQYNAVKAFLMALDNVKDFIHDDWQLSPIGAHTGLKWEMEVGDDDLLDDDFSDDEFDPEAAHDRLVEMMNRFGAH